MSEAVRRHKRIGILGGMSPESTIEYYQYLTRAYTQRYGDFGYPEILIYSVSFQPYVDWPEADRWDLVARGLAEAARRLERRVPSFSSLPPIRCTSSSRTCRPACRSRC